MFKLNAGPRPYALMIALMLTSSCALAQSAMRPQSQAGAEAEMRMRIMLMQRALAAGPGGGGIFAPVIGSMLGGHPGDPCGGYSDLAAIGACKNHDTWAADRLQRAQSPSSERDWYSR